MHEKVASYYFSLAILLYFDAKCTRKHMTLDTGRDLQTRREAEAFLVARGYRIAAVTLDAWDWMYAGVYEDAKKRDDTALQQQLVSSYLSYSDEMFAYSERLAKQTIAYEPKQV